MGQIRGRTAQRLQGGHRQADLNERLDLLRGVLEGSDPRRRCVHPREWDVYSRLLERIPAEEAVQLMLHYFCAYHLLLSNSSMLFILSLRLESK